MRAPEGGYKHQKRRMREPDTIADQPQFMQKMQRNSKQPGAVVGMNPFSLLPVSSSLSSLETKE
jgi:hypothetical protein